jgi:hypothetical protein
MQLHTCLLEIFTRIKNAGTEKQIALSGYPECLIQLETAHIFKAKSS